ncbi:MAG: FkbM family methyltransferase [Pikeienuella sp.]
MTEADDVERRFVRGREMVERGRQAFSEGHRILRGLSGEVRAARARGSIHQLIWDCERASNTRAQFFSESGQDAFLDERVFEGKRNGVFVEIGGFDGVTGSNCLFFELMRGWSGILVEPASAPRVKAAEFRRSPCLAVAAWEAAGEQEFIEFDEGPTQMSGIGPTYDPELLASLEEISGARARRRSVRTRSLAQILDSQYLRDVELISLDAMGAELRILEHFPFNEYSVGAWSIDSFVHGTEIFRLMERRGYKRVEALGTDDIYVRR